MAEAVENSASAPERPCFEIGLVLAGAISAGAYTAGVVDFLIEAIDAYDAARAAPGWDGPTHDVKIKVLAGASAGALVAAILASHIGKRFEHIDRESFSAMDPREFEAFLEHGSAMRGGPALRRRNNGLFNAWVDDVDIVGLTGTRDLDEPEPPLVSLLDSTPLQEIALDTFKIQAPAQHRAYVADPLPLISTVTNLGGVPYAFGFMGATGGSPYRMLEHADAVSFAIGRQGSEKTLPGHVPLDLNRIGAGAWEETLLPAALASAAFPIGLAARPITRRKDGYALAPRHFQSLVGTAMIDGVTRDVTYRGSSIPPSFPDGAPDDVVFVSVDGGVIDNEPLELARRVLSGGARNPRDGRVARRAIILVDPFPNQDLRTPRDPPDRRIGSVAADLFGALMNQARFKADELALADDSAVFSRFIIAPTRFDTNGKRHPVALASSILGGFGGFLHRSFRLHDYLLGRQNARSFLKRTFVLPESNIPIMAPQQQTMKLENWFAHRHEKDPDAASEPEVRVAPTVDGSDVRERALPIIPLVESLRPEVPIPAGLMPRPWLLGPGTPGRAALKSRICRRISAVGRRGIDQELGHRLGLNWPTRLVLKLAHWAVLRQVMTREAMRHVDTGIEALQRAFPRSP